MVGEKTRVGVVSDEIMSRPATDDDDEEENEERVREARLLGAPWL